MCLQAGGPGVLQKLGRVLREKAGGDLKQIFQGTAKTREKFGVCPCRLLCCAHRADLKPKYGSKQGVEELIAYWTLESSEDTLEELEETLIVGPAYLFVLQAPQVYTASKLARHACTSIGMHYNLVHLPSPVHICRLLTWAPAQH